MRRDSDTEPDVALAGPTAATVPGPRPRPPTQHPELQPGLPIGRYLLICPIGEGGMGVVYAAYDPKLDRKVALKFVRESESPRSQTRLLREAHAMAKLSHPNVLPIYDVGTFRGRVFLAIELVEGATLEEWLQPRRTTRQIVAAFLGAARGLAAAHSAELVHRDFKPSNVLVGNDGRVRVMDFGLARADRDSNEGEPEPQKNLLDDQLTVDGSVMGTLAYMAPEQRRAVPADDRSDQFSFCVALYEALYGESPFAGDGEARWEAIERGQIREAKKGATVPAYVRRAVVRGLAVDPEQRHPSMDALIAALRADPAVARRRLLFPAIAALVAVALVLAVLALRQDRAVTPCRGSEDKLAGIWNDAVRGNLATRFATLDKRFATDAWTRTRAIVDDYATRWTGMRQDVCEATRVRAEQSEAVMTLRMSCLDRRLDRLRALVTALGAADADASLRSADAARSLERLDDCADVEALEKRIKPPDGERAARVETLRAKLSELQVLFDLGKYDAKDRTAALAMDATALGYRALEAEVYELYAQYLRQGGQQNDEPAWITAFHAAEAAHDDRRKARLALRLAHANSFGKLDFKRAAEWLDLGSAIIESLGGDAELEGLLLHERGNVYIRQGRYADSLSWYRKALAVRQKLGDQWPVMETLHNIGIAEKESGSVDKALEAMSEATRIVERMLGPSHPELVEELENLSWVQIAANKKVEGLASSKRALELALEVLGPTNPRTGVAMVYVGSALNVNGKFAEGAEYAHRATELALDVERRLDAHTVEGKALGGLGNHREALATLELGLARAEKDLGRENPALSRVLVEIGNQRTKLGDFAAAIPPLERALVLRKDSNAEGRAEAAFLLAVALYSQDRPRALTLARQAREAFAGLAHHETELVEIDKWLAARR